MQTKIATYERVAGGYLDMTTPALGPVFDLGNRDAVVTGSRDRFRYHRHVSIEGRGLDLLARQRFVTALDRPGGRARARHEIDRRLAHSFAGDFTMADSRAPDFSVGALTSKMRCICNVAGEKLPVRTHRRSAGQRLIGSGALSIDFEKQTLTLFRSVPPDLAAQGWSPLPVRLDYSVPLVKAAYGNPG